MDVVHGQELVIEARQDVRGIGSEALGVGLEGDDAHGEAAAGEGAPAGGEVGFEGVPEEQDFQAGLQGYIG